MSTKSTRVRRKRRTPEERIQELRREIARLEEAKKAKASPARRQARIGLNALRKAVALAQEEGEGELERALVAAMESLGAGLGGDATGSGRRVRRSPGDLAAMREKLIAFLKENPNASVSTIAEALGESTKELRGPLVELLEQGRVQKKGERRGTRYFVRRKRSMKVN